jgi:hypothetical protein
MTTHAPRAGRDRPPGLAPTLDNVFMTYTGRSLDEDAETEGPEDDE